jgi:hypothetical protein
MAKNRSCLRNIEYVDPVCSKDLTDDADKTMIKPSPESAVTEVRIMKYGADALER